MTIKKLTHSNTEPRTVLPCPFLHLRLNVEVLSVCDGLSIALLKMLYPQTINSTPLMNRALQKWRGSSFGIEGQMKLGDLQEDQLTQTVFQSSTQMILDKARNAFICARVHSQPAFEIKETRLKKIKQQALNFYMTHGGRENKEKIDQLLLHSCMAVASFYQKILTDYWTMLSKNPWAGEYYEMIEVDIYSQLAEKTKQVLKDFELFKPPFQESYGHCLQLSLLEAFLGIKEDYFLQHQQAKTEELRFQADYQRLKLRLILKPLIQAILRRELTPLLSNPPCKIQKLAEKKWAESIAALEALQAELEGPGCNVDPAKVQAFWGFKDPSDPYLLFVLAANKADRAQRLKACEELAPFTHLDHCVKWARQQYGFNPDELRNVLNEETVYDRTIRRYITLTLPHQVNQAFDPDLSIDLDTLEDPVAYFVERFRKRDERVLALLLQQLNS